VLVLWVYTDGVVMTQPHHTVKVEISGISFKKTRSEEPTWRKVPIISHRQPLPFAETGKVLCEAASNGSSGEITVSTLASLSIEVQTD